jgi:hypothetical protein
VGYTISSDLVSDNVDVERKTRGIESPFRSDSWNEEYGSVSNFEGAKTRAVKETFDLDATIRFRWAGMDFLVVGEAKRHTHPIKRELVQVLHSKVQSAGAHKGVLFSTAPFQRGALEFAKVHGIALIHVTEGRFTFETKAHGSISSPSREEAMNQFGLPVFVGHFYGPGGSPGSTAVTLISTERPDYVREVLLGLVDEH